MMARLALKLGARNLSKHPRRTLLVGATITVGALVVVFNASLIEGIQQRLVEQMVITEMGHLRVSGVREGSRAQGEFSGAELIERPSAIVEILDARLPGAEISSTISSPGMLFSEVAMSSRVALVGIEPARDRQRLPALAERARGALDPLANRGAYLSGRLAARLEVQQGEVITISVPTAEGDLNAADFEVRGIIEAGPPWEDYIAYMELPALQELMAVAQGVHAIKIILPDKLRRREKLDSLAAGLEEELRTRASGIQVETYEQSGGFFRGIVTANRFFLEIMNAILLVAVALGVANALLLSVHERRQEIGAMMAMGAPRRLVRIQFAAEAAVAVLLFGSAGVLLGFALVRWLGPRGIALPLEAFSWLIGGARLFPTWDWGAAPRALVELVLAAVLASIVPSSRALRLPPVEALKGGRP
jgi:ABC-type lipoprotein release transport system permease subunit